MNWEDEFKYLLNRKILSRSELEELLCQVASVINREVLPLKKQIEGYQTATGWAKVIELEKELERVNRQRNIEQGGWEEVKKWQDNWVEFIEWWNIFKEGILALTKEECVNLIEFRIEEFKRKIQGDRK